MWAAEQDVGDHLDQWAHDFNREMQRAGGGFFSIKMDVQRHRQSRPFSWREDLLRDLICDICGRRYGVYAIALFCPDCGARNLNVHFRRELELVTQQIELAQRIGQEGDHELAYRLLGNAHEDVLTAFETYLKAIYRFLVRLRLPQDAATLNAKKTIRNRFQNIKGGQELFSKVGIDPYETLEEGNLSLLRVNIEKRHVVGHNLSMADEAYAQAAQSEQPGQTVQLLAQDIVQLAQICGAVIKHLEEDPPEFLPSSP